VSQIARKGHWQNRNPSRTIVGALGDLATLVSFEKGIETFMRKLRLAAISGLAAAGSQTVRIQIHQGGGIKGPGRSHRDASSKSYKPGDTVKQSGIFEVVHDAEHRVAHEVVMIAGDAFPNCETCDQKVRFRLVRTAPYIFQDQDFEEDK